jgi:hypothetical protein
MRCQIISAVVLTLLLVSCGEVSSPKEEAFVWKLNLNEPQGDSLSGDDFIDELEPLDLEEREAEIYAQILAGNLPAFLRQLTPIQFTENLHDTLYTVKFFVTPDYLSIGTDENHVLMPMTPILAQRVLDKIGGILPTPKMVDLIWKAASVKIQPEPIPPSSAMVTTPVFAQHNALVREDRNALLSEHPLGELVSGHKKDVILSNQIATKADKVVIYGWHYLNGNPIQPVYAGHVNWYADYSHGIRPVFEKCEVNGIVMDIRQILGDIRLFQLMSNESEAMSISRYDTSAANYP